MGARALVMGGSTVLLPTFFPSVSSVKANGRPSEYVRILTAAQEPRFLVSAYDVATSDASERNAMVDALSAATARWASILLDSGNYESFWKADPTWTPSNLATILASTRATLAFCYDAQRPVGDAALATQEVVGAVARDQTHAPRTTVCPIVHGTPEGLAGIVRSVGERLQPVLLGVAERELGSGILARAQTVRRLRATLDDVAPATVLHLLGTGSPIAMLVYAMVGAQSFDGLEWCHTCVDPDTVRLHHFQHRDLVRLLEPSVTLDLPYVPGTLLHNLLFFRAWLARVREALAEGTAPALLASVLPQARRDDVLAALEVQ